MSNGSSNCEEVSVKVDVMEFGLNTAVSKAAGVISQK